MISAKRTKAQAAAPVADPGPAASSQNAVRHGLRARAILMPWENPEQYNRLRDALFRQWQPMGDMECAMVQRMAESEWKLLRCGLIEAQILASLCDPEAPLGGLAAAFIGGDEQDDSHSLEKLRRYENSIERSLHRALRTLMEMQRLRQAWPAPNLKGRDELVEDHFAGEPTIWLAPATQAEPAPQEGFGGDGSFTVRRIVFDEEKIRAAIEREGHAAVYRRLETHPAEFAMDEESLASFGKQGGEPPRSAESQSSTSPETTDFHNESGILPNEPGATLEHGREGEAHGQAKPRKRKLAA
jgi:hypothetical protein